MSNKVLKSCDPFEPREGQNLIGDPMPFGGIGQYKVCLVASKKFQPVGEKTK